MVERRVYRVNYGYRALIDWAPTAQISSSNQGSGYLHSNPTSTLRGPHVYPDQKGRPLESQISSSNVPGHRGLFWDIYYWKRPSQVASKGRGITRDDALRNMDTLAQQWIYLAAEHANIHMNMTMDTMNLPKQERKNITKFFGSEEAGLGRMGQSMWSGSAEEAGHNAYPNMFSNISSKSYSSLPWFENEGGLGPLKDFNYETIKVGKSSKRVRTDYVTNTSGEQILADPQERHRFTNQTPQVQPEEMSMQLQKMVKGTTNRTSWLSQWSTSLSQEGPEGIKEMHRIMSEFMQREWEAGRISDSEYTVIIGDDDPKIYENEEPLPTGQSYGATIQERMVVATKLGISPEDAQVPRWVAASISKPIDVRLHDPVQVGGLHLQNFDLTTSIYQAKTGHHGTPTSVSGAVAAAKSVFTLEASISDDYNDPGGLIDKYNSLIDLLMKSALGTTKTGKARGPVAVRKQVLSESKRVEQIKNIAQATNLLDNELGNTAKAVLAMSDKELTANLAWALHYMGQSGELMAGEDFGNLMKINLPDGTVGTLIVGFDIVDGRFERAEVKIESGILPIEWIYNLLDEERRNKISLPELLEIVNAGHATGALEGTVTEGVFAKFAAIGTGNFKSRIGWSKISSAKFSRVLESVTAVLFEHIAANSVTKLKTDLHEEATRFSRAAREPSNLGSISQWYRYAFEEMTGGEAPSLSGDPFWYLWAAPYISTEWPQFGGGKQENI